MVVEPVPSPSAVGEGIKGWGVTAALTTVARPSDPTVLRYRPLKFGSRRSANEERPSLKSSLWNKGKSCR